MPSLIETAFVRILPNLEGFSKSLQTQLNASVRNVKTPAIRAPAPGTGLATTTAQSEALAVAETAATTAALELASALAAANTALVANSALSGKAASQAVILAAAQKKAGSAAKATTGNLLGTGSASGKLDAALLGVRTAAGSAAVIGLGAGALAAIALGKAFRASVASAASFEQELNTFQATVGATAAQMEAVSAAAKRLGADVNLPAVSAADAAVAMTELAKAGLSVEDSIAGAEGVLQLATAAQISNAQASEIAANALNAFGLSGDQAVRVADDLANAANAAQGSISDFGIAMQQVAAVGRQVGLSLEDTTALLSILAKNGLKGSDAGTSLRTALIRLINPTKDATALIASLGIEIRDAQGNVRPDVFAQFGQATADLSPKLRDAAIALVFGQDAIRAVAIAAREGAEGLRLMQFQIDQSGTAAELSAARTKGLAGDFEALKNNAANSGLAIGHLLTPALLVAIDTASLWATVLGKIADTITSLPDLKIVRVVLKFIGADSFFKGIRDDIKQTQQVGHFLDDLTRNTPLDPFFTPLSGEVNKTAEDIKSLTAQLNVFQKARIAAERAGQPGLADSFTPQIEKTRAEIKSLNQEISGGGRRLGDPSANFLGNLRKNLLAARNLPGIDTGFIDKQLAKVNQAIVRTFNAQGEGARAAVAAAKITGGKITEALASGITAAEQKSIDAARQVLADVIAAGQEQVRAAVQSANENLISLGDKLSQDLSDIISAPFDRQIKAIDKSIQALQDRISQRGLKLDLTDAKRALKDFNESIVTPDRLSAGQRQQVADERAKLLAAVADKTDAARVAALEKRKGVIEATRDKAKELADKALKNIVTQFELGRISGDKFKAALNNLLKGPIASLKKEGINLGLSFTTGFLRDVQNIRDQVKELMGFIGFAGAAAGTNVQKPGQAVSAAAKDRKTAQDNLAQAIKDARKASDATATNTGTANVLLAQILTSIATSSTSPGGRTIKPQEVAPGFHVVKGRILPGG